MKLPLPTTGRLGRQAGGETWTAASEPLLEED